MASNFPLAGTGENFLLNSSDSIEAFNVSKRHNVPASNSILFNYIV